MRSSVHEDPLLDDRIPSDDSDAPDGWANDLLPTRQHTHFVQGEECTSDAETGGPAVTKLPHELEPERPSRRRRASSSSEHRSNNYKDRRHSRGSRLVGSTSDVSEKSRLFPSDKTARRDHDASDRHRRRDEQRRHGGYRHHSPSHPTSKRRYRHRTEREVDADGRAHHTRRHYREVSRSSGKRRGEWQHADATIAEQRTKEKTNWHRNKLGGRPTDDSYTMRKKDEPAQSLKCSSGKERASALILEPLEREAQRRRLEEVRHFIDASDSSLHSEFLEKQRTRLPSHSTNNSEQQTSLPSDTSASVEGTGSNRMQHRQKHLSSDTLQEKDHLSAIFGFTSGATLNKAGLTHAATSRQHTAGELVGGGGDSSRGHNKVLPPSSQQVNETRERCSSFSTEEAVPAGRQGSMELTGNSLIRDNIGTEEIVNQLGIPAGPAAGVSWRRRRALQE